MGLDGEHRVLVSRHAAVLAALLGLGAPAASACGVELVLALDVSRSVINAEYDLQKGGLARALADPAVVNAITTIEGGVMATVSEWSGPDAQAQTVPWRHLTDKQSVAAFVTELQATRRQFFAAFTAVGDALWHANALSATNPKRCKRRVIDVSGDGVSNRGRAPAPIADALARNGVTVNALIITGAKPDPVPFYETNVIRGPGAFLEIANGFRDYARAMRRKLLRELAPAVASADTVLK